MATLTYSTKSYGFLINFELWGGARGYGVGARGYGKLWVFDNLLLDHVGLPLVVILAVHLVIFCAGWAKGIILRHSY